MKEKGRQGAPRDKYSPHHSLEGIQRLVKTAKWHPTTSALKNALEDFGLLEPGIENAILAMRGREFYKSMTSKSDYTIWQDVYLTRVSGLEAYVKLQIADGACVVISFKRKS